MNNLSDTPRDLHADDACVTTHVLDLEKGLPLAGMEVSISRLAPGGEEPLMRAVTNGQGRLAAPLLTTAAAQAGTHVIAFDTANGFFGRIRVEFEIADPARHYHVPLILSPFGFSTYRGAPPHRPPAAAPPPRDMAGPGAAAASAAPPGSLGPGLTVHVIDMARGIGAGGMALEVSRPSATAGSFVTNAEGRTADWLVGPGGLEPGGYEIRFDLAGYFAALGTRSFFTRAHVGFRVTDATRHHHIPLLVAPAGYSCYRGS